MNEGLEGGCACGAVRFRLTSAPMFVHCCHCRDCQRQTGSAFVLNAMIETDRITLLSGDLEPVATPTDSGRPHDIHRCRACRTALWSDYGRRRALRFVRIGTLDEPARLAPDVHIYTRSKLPWVELGKTSLPSRPTTTRGRCGQRPVLNAVGRSSADRGPSRRHCWCSRARAIGASDWHAEVRHDSAIASRKTGTLRSLRLTGRSFQDNAMLLQLLALAYNLANFLR